MVVIMAPHNTIAQMCHLRKRPYPEYYIESKNEVFYTAAHFMNVEMSVA